MRKLFFTAALTFASLSLGQGYDPDGLPEGGATIAPDADDAPPPLSSGKASAPGQQHTVTKGDTLWDLTQKYLGSPWYWPKVWSYNPEIANPHWIYPGNEVRFYAGGEEVPARVEAGEEVEEGERYDDQIAVAGQIGFRPKAGQAIATPGFITSEEVEAVGRIEGSFAESIALTYPDHLYVRFNKKAPRAGEVYLLMRDDGEIQHPITQRSVGVLTLVLAEAKVIRVDGDKQATLQIVKQYDEVRRGDLVGPVGEPVIRRVSARRNDKEIKDARLVADVRRFPTNMGEHQMVVIDKGSEDGVKVGTTFTFWRQHDPLPANNLMRPALIDEAFPREDIGACVAFDVKKRASICLVSASIRDLVRGDHAEARVEGSRRAAR